MKNYGVCAISVSLILTVLLINEANALRCWHCSSDSMGGEFCADPFRPDNLSTNEKLFSYIECEPSTTAAMRPVCKKLSEKINGQLIIKRSCFYEDNKDSSKHCTNSTKASAPLDVEVLLCETCLEDGCNGATEFTPVAIVSLIPVFIARLLAW